MAKIQRLSCQGSTTILCRSMNCEPCKRLRNLQKREREALAKKAELERDELLKAEGLSVSTTGLESDTLNSKEFHTQQVPTTAPVETRPPAPLDLDISNRLRKSEREQAAPPRVVIVPNHGDLYCIDVDGQHYLHPLVGGGYQFRWTLQEATELKEKLDAKYPAAAPAAIEQTPRPLCKCSRPIEAIRNDNWHQFDCPEYKGYPAKTRESVWATEREPQRSEVKPNEAQSQKSAAIEQARPQPPEFSEMKGATLKSEFEVLLDLALAKAERAIYDALLTARSVAELAEIVGLTSSEASVYCGRLCEKGLIKQLFRGTYLRRFIPFNTKSAAAEPAPERTPPQDFIDFICNELIGNRLEQKRTAKGRAIAARRSGVADCRQSDVETLEELRNTIREAQRARTVAVPEPAAQQPNLKQLRQELYDQTKLSEEAINEVSLWMMKRNCQ